jgi:hypothetical protein
MYDKNMKHKSSDQELWSLHLTPQYCSEGLEAALMCSEFISVILCYNGQKEALRVPLPCRCEARNYGPVDISNYFPVESLPVAW